jgi:hypothetical protein
MFFDDLNERIARNFEATSEIVPRPIPVLPTPLHKRESLRFPPTVYPPSPTPAPTPPVRVVRARLVRPKTPSVPPVRTILFTLRYNLLTGAWQCREDCRPPYACVFGKGPK